MRDGELRHDQDELSNPPEWNDQAEKKQQMVRPAEDVLETKSDELERGLVPVRIQMHESRVCRVLESALRARGRLIPEHRDDVDAEAAEGRLDRKGRPVRRDRVFEQDVEERLVPVERRVERERRAGDVRQRGVIGDERAIRRQRDWTLAACVARECCYLNVSGLVSLR